MKRLKVPRGWKFLLLSLVSAILLVIFLVPESPVLA